MPYLSIISPVYRTGAILPALIRQISEALPAVTADYEIILVDDGSPDDAWSRIEGLCAVDPHIKGVKLSRNFGQHRALAAGMEASSGEFVIAMDSDLEDDPREIVRLMAEAEKGWPITLARRVSRTDGVFRRLGSKVFYFLISRLSGLPADYTIGNYGVYCREVVDRINTMREIDWFLPMVVNWVGFPKQVIEVPHGKRQAGRSAYNGAKLIRLAFYITLAYSDKPLRYVVKAGFVIAFISFLFGLYVFIRFLEGKIVVLGYTSIILSIWFLGGIILSTLGVVGVYVGKTLESVKGRPLYIIEKTIN